MAEIIKTQTGKIVQGDLEENTITIEVEGKMIIQAGRYAIVPIDTFENEKYLLKKSRDQLVLCTLIDKSGQCKTIVDQIDKMMGYK